MSGVENFEKAIEDFKKADSKFDSGDQVNRHKVAFNLGIVYRRLGRLEESLAILAKAVSYNQAQAATQNNFGLSFFDNKDYVQAADHFQSAATIEEVTIGEGTGKGSRGELAFYYNNIGLNAYHMSQTEDADPAECIENSLKNYNLAISCNPDEPVYYFNRGNVHLNSKNFDDAHKDFDRALQLKNDNPKFYHAKGLCFQAQADDAASKDKNLENEFIHKAIDQFSESQERGEWFYSAVFHQAQMFRRI
jgi:tetratricopeptide (TPR) repeat protein